ncbi:hypothetical protein CYY_004086 [Polysphondylium violaceum]|uniref:Gamete and mating-type specific protein A n=1 Tax=Polysphondylium violaceum TaxID=133409 RepID=A0A8J4PVZ6_9MYCE|nr:hypothetical protein CYY_004086 [Polysphondylium violaceum]
MSRLNYLFICFIVAIIGQIVVIEAALTQAEINIIVDYHKRWRASPDPAAAKPLAQLTWDANIAKTLQTHLDKCDGKFSPQALNSVNSEFSYWWSPAAYFNLNSTLNTINSQKANFDWTAKACKPNTSCLSWVFTMWSTTTKFGCAKSICADKAILSCDYNPPGGYSGVVPYTKATTTPAPTTTPKPTTTPAPTTTPKPTSSPTTPAPTTTPKPSTTPAPTVPPVNFVDWSNYQTPIRDQGQCGSCWTFGSVAAMESRYLIKNGLSQKATLDLSEQNALSCLPNGCNGGWHSKVYSEFLAPGIAYEVDDPYKTVVQTCVKTSTKPRFKYANYGYTASNNKQAMIDELKKGPISVSLYVDSAFQAYKTGTFNCATKYTTTNHIVLLVGYNPSGDYWLIKNSWGTWWGQSGYMKLNAANDNCYMLGYSGYFPTF